MLLLWYSSSLLAEGVTGSEGGTSPKAGFESTGPLSEQHLSAGSRRKGREIFSSRKYNFRSEMGWSCFGDAGMGRQRLLGSHFFYPLFWGAREGRKSKKRRQKKGKSRILHNGVHSLSNEEIHRSDAEPGPLVVPSPDIRPFLIMLWVVSPGKILLTCIMLIRWEVWHLPRGMQ